MEFVKRIYCCIHSNGKEEIDRAEICTYSPEKLKHTKKTNADRKHDASFEQKLKIYVLASRGASVREIVEYLEYTKDLIVSSSKRSEEAMKIGLVESKPKKNADTGRKLIYSTPKKRRNCTRN